MLLIDHIQSAYTILIRQKLRTILTIMALGIGVASVVIIISAGKGLESMVLGELDMYNPNTLNIEVRIPGKGHVGSGTGMASGVEITTLKNTDMEDIEKLDNIGAVYGYLTTQEVMKYQGQNKTIIIFGYGARAPEVETIELAEGRFYTIDEENSLAQVVVIGSKIKEDLFGADTAVGKNVYMDGKSFMVVGELVERGASFGFDFDSVVYMPMRIAQKKLMGIDYMMGINARIIDMDKVEYTIKDVQILLRDNHDISDASKDDFAITTMEEIRDTLGTVLGGITVLLVALVCISLVVGGVGITNIMYVTVAERTFEIGLRKSLGAKRTDILWQFLIEAMMLTFAGGVFGLLCGVLISYLIYYGATSYGLNWKFVVPLYAVFLSIGFSTLVGLFFGMYPAKKAADLDPIVALRKE